MLLLFFLDFQTDDGAGLDTGCQIPKLGQWIQLNIFDFHPCWAYLPLQV